MYAVGKQTLKMSEYFFLPITRSEFIDWYNRREKKYSAIELIPAELDEDKERVEIDGEWKEVLVEIIPEYDEDFEVLISLVEVDRETVHQFIETEEHGSKEGPKFQKLDILNLRKIYPLTKRGARMLEVRLPSNIELGPPLFEEAIREKEEELVREQAEAGGTALLEIFDLEINKGQIDSLKEEILGGVHKKVTRQEDAPPDSLLEAVIRYDRQDQPTFPSTPIGSCYDYLEVLKTHLRRMYHEDKIGKDLGYRIKEIFEDAGAVLREMGQHASPYEALNKEEFTEHLRALESEAQINLDRCPPEAAVLFLDLRDQLRENDDLETTTAEKWIEALRDQDKERGLAIGLWMVGAFFDFSTFADVYYEFKDADFLSEPVSSTAE